MPGANLLDGITSKALEIEAEFDIIMKLITQRRQTFDILQRCRTAKCALFAPNGELAAEIEHYFWVADAGSKYTTSD